MKNVFVLLWILLGILSGKSQQKPNIVLFIADDLGATDLSLYGDPTGKTPNIDALAKESLLFTRAFATSPTCSPSRASFLTGLMPFRNGAHENHAGINEGVKTLPQYLKEIGYRTAIAGKYHIGPMDAYPFEMIHGTNVPEPGHEDDGVLWTDLKLGPVDKWLSEFKKKDSEPFLLVVNDHSPHVFWPESPQYKLSEVRIPSKHIDTDETREARAKYYTDITKMDANLGQLMASLRMHNLLDNTIVIFTADQGPQWPFGKWSLYDYGIRVPLLIKWPKVIEGGSETSAMVSLVDLVPTVLNIAGAEIPQYPSAIDGKTFLPVLKNLTTKHRDRIFATHTGDGNMNPTPMRMVRSGRYKYLLNLAPEVKYTTHMDKTGNKGEGGGYWPSWVEKSYENEHAASVLYRYHNHPKEELYDILSDPQEEKNLSFDPQYKMVLEGFRAEMNAWREQQDDFETGPYKPSEKKKKGIPYIFK